MASPRFVTTRWSVVLAAGGATGDGRAALETLCQAYWYPLYAYARRKGRDAAAAEDAVQAFFADLLAREALAAADPARGRFRAFLLTSFKNHLRNEATRAKAQKRGGDRLHLSLDVEASEARFALEPSHGATPERVYLRDWALSLLKDVLGGLRQTYAGRGKEELFDALKPCLVAGDQPATMAEIAEALGMREGAVKVAAHRLRLRYREALLEAVADTVEAEEQGEAELRELLQALQPLT